MARCMDLALGLGATFVVAASLAAAVAACRPAPSPAPSDADAPRATLPPAAAPAPPQDAEATRPALPDGATTASSAPSADTATADAPTREEAGAMRRLWTRDDVLSSPPTALEDGIVACFRDGDSARLVRLSRENDERWSVPLGGPCMAPPVVDGAQVFVRVPGDGVVALSVADGAALWTASPDADFARERPTEAWDWDGRWYLFERRGPWLLAASRLKLYALDPADGQTRWTNESYNLGESYVFEANDGLAVLKAGGPSPFSATRGSGSWGGGDVYRLQPKAEVVARIATGEALATATGATGSAHHASAPVRVGDQTFALVQRYGPIAPAQIKLVDGGGGRKVAVGGSLDPPEPSGLSLVRLVDGAVAEAADVTSDLGHAMAATGVFTNPRAALVAVDGVLVFATDRKDGDATVLQAWGPDLRRRWQLDGLVLLGGTERVVLAARDESDALTKRNSAFGGKGAMELVAVSGGGEVVGALALPWPAFSMPFGPTGEGDVVYLTSPDRKLLAIRLPEAPSP